MRHPHAENLHSGLPDQEKGDKPRHLAESYDQRLQDMEGYMKKVINESKIEIQFKSGIVNLQTSFGHPVPVYDMERTICDLIRSWNNIEIQTLQGALKQYALRKDKNLRMLMNYAGLFHVEKILRQYLEVLL